MIRSKWTLDHYRNLIGALLDRRLAPLDIDGYARRQPGFWLRHDVELSLDAAVAMAEVEADLGVPSSYFVCVESPYFPTEAAVVATIDELRRLARDVSFHLVLATEAGSISDRLRALAQRIPSVEPLALTFHAPGAPIADLISQPLGSIVYQPLVDASGRYFSDSTGKWRWGHPVHSALEPSELVQILTHPFWWFGGNEAAELADDQALTFLPQLTADAVANETFARFDHPT